jgi:transposase
MAVYRPKTQRGNLEVLRLRVCLPGQAVSALDRRDNQDHRKGMREGASGGTRTGGGRLARRAIVLCVDEKSQVQALDRTRPLLPLRPGLPERQTHDSIRHGTTSWLAALEVAAGRGIGKCLRRHRSRGFRQFLEAVEGQLPPEPEIHIVMDNCGTHKTPPVRRWFARHLRYHLHFTPTSAGWLNQVERFFAEITQRRIRRGSFQHVRELQQAIHHY